MGKHIKLFETTIKYNEVKANLILPNVSLCKDNKNTIFFNPYIEPEETHEYVEIGGIKWATMNIGANSITDTGLYFQWGDTQGYTAEQIGINKQFDWNNYIYVNGLDEDDNPIFSKYNSKDNKITLDASDDAVNAAWGGNWRMPTIDEYFALGKVTSCTFIEDYQDSGVSGYLFVDTTDNTKTLFLPFAGTVFSNNPNQINDSYTYYWTSTSAAECGIEWASAVQFAELDYPLMSVGNDPHTRASGLVIRGILDE